MPFIKFYGVQKRKNERKIVILKNNQLIQQQAQQ